MPTYRVTDPKTGRTLKLNGDTPPSEQQLGEIFAGVSGDTNVPQSQSAQPSYQPSGLDKAASFMNIRGLGKGLSQAVNSLDPRINRDIEEANKVNKQSQDMAIQGLKKARQSGDQTQIKKWQNILKSSMPDIDYEKIITNGEGFASNKEVIGGAVGAVANIAMAGQLLGKGQLAQQTIKGVTVPGVAKVVGSGVPKSALGKFLTGNLGNFGARTTGRVLSGAGTGAVVSGSAAAQENKSWDDIVDSSIKGAVVGGALSGVAGAAGDAVQGIKNKMAKTGQDVTRKLYPTPGKQLEAGKKAIGDEISQRGFTGSSQQVHDRVQELYNVNNKKFGEIIANNRNKTVTTDSILGQLNQYKEELAATGESFSGVDDVINAIKDKKILNIEEAQKLKQIFQKQVNNSFLNENVTQKTGAQKIVAQNLRKLIEEAVPDVIPVNKEMEFANRALPVLKKLIGSPEKRTNILEAFGVGSLNRIPLPNVGSEKASKLAQGLIKSGQSVRKDEPLLRLLKNLGLVKPIGQENKSK